MRKLIIVLALLTLVCSISYAIDKDQAITNELAAQWKARSVTSDNSVLFKVWYVGTGAGPSVGVSDNVTMLLYEDCGSTSVGAGTYTTLQDMVTYVDDLASWEASLGPDGYGAQTSNLLLGAASAAAGGTESAAVNVELDCSTATYMTAGVAAKEGTINRIKSIDTSLASADDNITITLYDGDTAVWTKWISAAAYKSTTAGTASSNTVIFTTGPEKGIAGAVGNEMCVVVDSDGAIDTDATAKAGNRVVVIYDQLKQ